MQYVFGIVCLIYIILFFMSNSMSGKTPFDKMATYLVQITRKAFGTGYGQYKKGLSDTLQRLYPMENPEILFQNFQVEKWKKLLFIFFVGTVFAFIISFGSSKEYTLTEENQLTKNTFQEGSKTVSLTAQTPDADKETTMEITVEERKYQSYQLDELFTSATEELINRILSENKSSDEVRSSLSLINKIPNYPFTISWEISDSSYMDETGQLKGQIIDDEGKLLELTAVFTYEDYKREYSFSVRLMPVNESEQEKWERALAQEVELAIEASKYEEKIQLPNEVDGGQIIWTEKTEDTGKTIFLLLVLVVVMIFYFHDKDLEKKLEERDFHMQMEYAPIIHKLTLYLGSGMTVRGAIAKIATDYEEKKKKEGVHQYAFEEILKLYQEMNNGVMELAAYVNFGKRCRLQMYIKLATLLSQNTKKGNDNLISQLTKEAEVVMESRKNLALKLGEEAGTKLLFPMLLMMGIVMVLIMVPAFLSF